MELWILSSHQANLQFGNQNLGHQTKGNNIWHSNKSGLKISQISWILDLHFSQQMRRE